MIGRSDVWEYRRSTVKTPCLRVRPCSLSGSALVAQRRRRTRKAAAQRDKRRAELERKAREDLDRVAKMAGGNGRGV